MAERIADRRGLGRGLGELFQRTEPAIVVERDSTAEPHTQTDPASPASAGTSTPIPDGSYFAEISLEAITPNPRQPRTNFDEEAMAELVDSISEVGLLQPIVVRPLPEDRFELVMGERRWRAAKMAGLKDVPVVFSEQAQARVLLAQVVANENRENLTDIELAKVIDTITSVADAELDKVVSP